LRATIARSRPAVFAPVDQTPPSRPLFEADQKKASHGPGRIRSRCSPV
jgi:hypothetical protein